MADINPQTTYHLALTEREYNLVTLALAIVAGADLRPQGQHRRLAAELNLHLLERARVLFDERAVALMKKLEKAPPVPEVEEP